MTVPLTQAIISSIVRSTGVRNSTRESITRVEKGHLSKIHDASSVETVLERLKSNISIACDLWKIGCIYWRAHTHTHTHKYTAYAHIYKSISTHTRNHTAYVCVYKKKYIYKQIYTVNVFILVDPTESWCLCFNSNFNASEAVYISSYWKKCKRQRPIKTAGKCCFRKGREIEIMNETKGKKIIASHKIQELLLTTWPLTTNC